MRFLPLALSAAFLGSSIVGNAAEHAPAGHSHAAKQGIEALDVYADAERLHLLTADYPPGSSTPILRYQHSLDAGRTWSAGVRVDEGQPAPQGAHRGMDPQIAGHGENLIAVWMTRGTGLFDSGPMATALSKDGGKTWAPGPNPADDGSTGGHGFIDLAVDAAGTFHLTWLDNRTGAQGLHYASSTNAGESWSANRTVDAKTCECCWNTLATGPEGPFLLYRDAEPRDMRLAALDASGSVKSAGPVGAFRWDFTGCPHVGGGLAVVPTSTGATLHAAVWTGQAEAVGLHYLRSVDGGKQWTPGVRFGGEAAWHPDIAADSANRVALVWDTQESSGRGEIWATLSQNGGEAWSAPQRLSPSGVAASHPKVIRTTEGFRVFWTQASAESAGSVWASVALPLEK